MTDEQGFEVFKCIHKYLWDRDKLSKGAALDLRPYIERVIDSMLDEARKQGRAELKEKLVEFAGSKRTIATADLLRLLGE